jgi:SAM-dependent methyltransferase
MSSPGDTCLELFAALLSELGFEVERVHMVDPADPDQDQRAARAAPGHVLVAPIGYAPDLGRAAQTWRQRSQGWLADDGAVILFLKGERSSAELARWRNALWPWLHAVALVRLGADGARLSSLHTTERLSSTVSGRGVLILCRRRGHVLSPETTIEKFDQNASGWNAAPSSGSYGHFRWMRRLVGAYARLSSPPTRVLDFGCGAGWIGIEAARLAPGAELCAFDPSPELVRAAEENARAAGIARFQARQGFGEDPPFPAAGEAPFDAVYSSGVISFSPDHERWADGLARTVAPGGALVVADINPDSRGMQWRRRAKPLLPARELNALTAQAMRALLEARGFTFQRGSFYQLTRPIPQAMHLSDTRLGGLLSAPLLLLNRAAAVLDARSGSPMPSLFDSWVMHLQRK